MPNWCYNNMKVTGAAEEIARFKQTCVVDSEFDFNTVIPMPAEVRDSGNRNARGIPDWVEWSCENWGTQWNACRSCIMEGEDGGLLCCFKTAWTPPEPVWRKLGELFPTLTFELEVSSLESDFAGKGSIRGGHYEMREVPAIWTVIDPKTGESVSGTSAELEELGRW
jgi:hypothetical protein